jgi:hypothetical protein
MTFSMVKSSDRLAVMEALGFKRIMQWAMIGVGGSFYIQYLLLPVGFSQLPG